MKRKRIIACAGLLVMASWFGWWGWLMDFQEWLDPHCLPAFYWDDAGYGHCTVVEG